VAQIDDAPLRLSQQHAGGVALALQFNQLRLAPFVFIALVYHLGEPVGSIRSHCVTLDNCGVSLGARPLQLVEYVKNPCGKRTLMNFIAQSCDFGDVNGHGLSPSSAAMWARNSGPMVQSISLTKSRSSARAESRSASTAANLAICSTLCSYRRCPSACAFSNSSRRRRITSLLAYRSISASVRSLAISASSMVIAAAPACNG